MTPHEGPQISLPELLASLEPALIPTPAVHWPAHEGGFLIGVGGTERHHHGVEQCLLHHAFNPVLSDLRGLVYVPDERHSSFLWSEPPGSGRDE